ncbi:CASA2 protein, partial [Crocuta crocuta]
QDCSGNRYLLNPSLSIPYPVSGTDSAPSFRPSENKVPHYPGNPDPHTEVPSFPWILTSPSPGAPFYHTCNFRVTAWPISSPPPQESSHVVPNSHRPEGPSFSPNAPLSPTADPSVATPHVATSTTPPPHLETVAVEPGPIEPDDAEPVAPEPQPPSSP